MLATLGKYTTVILSSTFKFILGPLTGFPLGLNLLETYLCTVIGMMITVVVLSYVGEPVRKKWLQLFSKNKSPKLFTSRNRRIVRIWNKYGMVGVAFLTPLLLSPPVGTLIAVSFGEHKHKIMLYMLISAAFWGIISSATIQVIGVQVVKAWIE